MQLALKESEVQTAYVDFQISLREASDLQLLANIRRNGVKLNKPKKINYYFLARNRDPLTKTAKDLTSLGFKTNTIESRKDSNQETFYLLMAKKQVNLLDLKSVFSISTQLTQLGNKYQVQYDGWAVQ